MRFIRSVRVTSSRYLSQTLLHMPEVSRHFTSSQFIASKEQNTTLGGLTARTTGILRTLLDSGSSRQARRLALSRAVTLIESTEARRKEQASIMLQAISDASLVDCPPVESSPSSASGAFRVGFAGPPGAGKSSFIEKFGLHVLGVDADGKPTRSLASESPYMASFSPSTMAVLSIDPSSSYSGGSILGDKTRMPELSRHPDCFIRPSPTSTNLGGINAYTNDVIQLCQAGGYDLVVVETVGVGQSEVEVDKAVDMLILLVPPGGGDELQGVKKGIVEVADMLIVNKADGALLTTARHTCADYRGAVKWQGRGKSDIREGWKGERTSFTRTSYDVPHIIVVSFFSPTLTRPSPRLASPADSLFATVPVLMASAKENTGVDKVWEQVMKFKEVQSKNGGLEEKRRRQGKYWMWKQVQEIIRLKTESDDELKEKANTLDRALMEVRRDNQNNWQRRAETRIEISPQLNSPRASLFAGQGNAKVGCLAVNGSVLR